MAGVPARCGGAAAGRLPAALGGHPDNPRWRPADVHGDLVLIGGVVSEWVPAPRYLATLTDLACAHSELSVGDAAALALARAAHLPLVTGVADLAGVDPEVAVMILARRP